jgi:hypothetical protein
MSSDHLRELRNARNTLIDARRVLASKISPGKYRAEMANIMDEFMRLQSTIEAIDRAIEDERRLASGEHGEIVYTTAVPREDPFDQS